MKNRVLKKNDFNKLMLWNYCIKNNLAIHAAAELFNVSAPSIHRMVQEINADLSTKTIEPQLFIKNEQIQSAPQLEYSVRSLLLEIYLEHSQVYRILRHLYSNGPTSSYDLAEHLAISYSYVLKSIHYINSELDDTSIQIKKEGKNYRLHAEKNNLHTAVCLIRSYLNLTPTVKHELLSTHTHYNYLEALVEQLAFEHPLLTDAITEETIVQALCAKANSATFLDITVLVLLGDHPDCMDQLPLATILKQPAIQQRFASELARFADAFSLPYGIEPDVHDSLSFKFILVHAIETVLPKQTLHYFSLLTSRITATPERDSAKSRLVTTLSEGLLLGQSSHTWYHKELTDALAPFISPELKVAITCLSPQQAKQLQTFIQHRLSADLVSFVPETEAEVVISNYPKTIASDQIHLPLDSRFFEDSAKQITSHLLALAHERC